MFLPKKLASINRHTIEISNNTRTPHSPHFRGTRKELMFAGSSLDLSARVTSLATLSDPVKLTHRVPCHSLPDAHPGFVHDLHGGHFGRGWKSNFSGFANQRTKTLRDPTPLVKPHGRARAHRHNAKRLRPLSRGQQALSRRVQQQFTACSTCNFHHGGILLAAPQQQVATGKQGVGA